jgi:hypothetical protein
MFTFLTAGNCPTAHSILRLEAGYHLTLDIPCEIKSEPPKYKSDIAQCANLNDVSCVLCGGNHPANYKGYLVYKEL